MNSFEGMCNEAVKRFIKTVAIIDDEATYDLSLPSQDDKDEQKSVQSPATGMMMREQSMESSAPNADKTEDSTQRDDDTLSQLDAKTVINAFADIGIACCIQRPEREDDPLERAVKLAASVDVLVIDWLLNKKNRMLCRDIIKKILEEDKKTGNRMRLIIVYTSHNHVSEMLDDIKKDVDEVYADDPLTGKRELQKGNLLLKNDWIRIVILNKEITNIPGSRIVPFDKLPETIISESSEMMKGIIPGATLHGIAAIRENTHKLLSILNSNLDGAYCFHRASIPEPSDSVDFAMNLVTNEINTIIRTDVLARNIVDEKGLKAWLKQHVDNKSKIPCFGGFLSVEIIEQCILNGLLSDDKSFKTIVSQDFKSNWVSSKDSTGKTQKCPSIDFKNNFMDVLCSTPQDPLNGCYELSNLQCTAMDVGGRLYDRKSQNPTLHLGTILKKRNRKSSEWFLCLTPLCDSVRLEGESNFLFLQLYPEANGKADIIIRTQDGIFETLMFKQKNKKIKVVTIPFSPKNGAKKIEAYPWRKEWRVKSEKIKSEKTKSKKTKSKKTKSKDTISYQWAGELRYSKALGVAHYVATQNSRVGIDEFEWLRQKATL